MTKAYKVLIVEDESSIRDNIRVALQSEGFSIFEAPTASVALDIFQSQGVDFVVLDVGLPDLSGFEICKVIRKTSLVPILFLTARNQEIDKIVGFEVGADDYLTKPFSPRELVVRIRAILKRTQGSSKDKNDPDSSWTFGPFVIEPQKFKISFQNHNLELSRYEYKLLEVLLKRPGIVFSRQQLMDLIWEDPTMSMERTIDTHIKSIRSKLKSVDENTQVIETHRGQGYSLREDF